MTQKEISFHFYHKQVNTSDHGYQEVGMPCPKDIWCVLKTHRLEQLYSKDTTTAQTALRCRDEEV